MDLEIALKNLSITKKFKLRFFGLDTERDTYSISKLINPDVPILNVIFDYDPFQEIMEALEISIKDDKNMLTTFFNALHIHRPVDFVIRTGGYQTLSNFIPLMIGYSRMAFISDLFNDLHIKEFDQIYEEFFSRPRRYGL